jgi:hypothetical protein
MLSEQNSEISLQNGEVFNHVPTTNTFTTKILHLFDFLWKILKSCDFQIILNLQINIENWVLISMLSQIETWFKLNL